MKDRIANAVRDLTTPIPVHASAVMAGVVAFAVVNQLVDRGRALILTKDAFDALVNDETNLVRFTSNKHDHVFHIHLEQ